MPIVPLQEPPVWLPGMSQGTLALSEMCWIKVVSWDRTCGCRAAPPVKQILFKKPGGIGWMDLCMEKVHHVSGDVDLPGAVCCHHWLANGPYKEGYWYIHAPTMAPCPTSAVDAIWDMVGQVGLITKTKEIPFHTQYSRSTIHDHNPDRQLKPSKSRAGGKPCTQGDYKWLAPIFEHPWGDRVGKSIIL